MLIPPPKKNIEIIYFYLAIQKAKMVLELLALSHNETFVAIVCYSSQIISSLQHKLFADTLSRSSQQQQGARVVFSFLYIGVSQIWGHRPLTERSIPTPISYIFFRQEAVRREDFKTSFALCKPDFVLTLYDFVS